MISLMIGLAMAAPSQKSDWTPDKLLSALSSKDGLRSAKAEEELTAWFGGVAKLATGADAKADGLTFAFAIRVPEGGKFASVKALTEDLSISLVQVGKGRLFVGAAKFPLGECFRWVYTVDGRTQGNPRELEAFIFPKEAKPQPNVAKGKLEVMPRMTSKVFGGTWHDWWLYTPAKFDAATDSNLVVFQDGQWAHEYVPTFFDNLIAQGDFPQTVVVLVTPGTFPDGRSDRSREYDSLGDAYVRFLLEELLPPVESKFKITQDPMRRCVAGLSSGGICSFTAAWERPDKFGLVMSWIGSFANLQGGPSGVGGGNTYPAMIRKRRGWDGKGAPKPIRVYLQDGSNDLDNAAGSWPIANQDMAAALKFGGYDYKFVYGKGFHSAKHGQVEMPNAMRWLFRKEK